MKKYNNYTEKDLTLIICAYKECQYLEKCIQSVVQQTQMPNLMISTSTPNEYIYTLANKYNLEVKVNKDGGQIKDYNFAMNVANTELIMLMHQDEILVDCFVESVIEKLNYEKDPIIAFTNYIEMHNDIVDSHASIMVMIKRIMLLPMRIPIIHQFNFTKRWIQLFGNPITHPTVVCVKKKMPEVCFDEKYQASMDWDLWERLSRQRGSFVYVAKVLLFHRMNDENQTSKLLKTTNARYDDELDIFCRFWPKWIAKLIMLFYSKAANFY